MRRFNKNTGVFAVSRKKNVAEVLIYDEIGASFWGDGLSAKAFVTVVNDLPEEIDTILVRVNSPGGDVFDGVAIYNALKQFRGAVEVQIDGLCASIASVIAMAGTKVTMAETATLMIHNAWTLAAGDSSDLRKTADLLDKVRDNSMLPAYARSGKTPEEIVAIMADETWYSAAEAVEAGWVDSILELPVQEKAAAHARYDLSAFKHPPAALVKAETDCTCPCAPCVDGNCVDCSDPGCQCEGCTCDAAMGASAAAAKIQQSALIAVAVRDRNLRLAEFD